MKNLSRFCGLCRQDIGSASELGHWKLRRSLKEIGRLSSRRKIGKGSVVILIYSYCHSITNYSRKVKTISRQEWLYMPSKPV